MQENNDGFKLVAKISLYKKYFSVKNCGKKNMDNNKPFIE